MKFIKKLRQLSVLAVLLALFLAVPPSAFAAPSFRLNPSSGYILENSEFTIDILIDSGGSELLKAKSVLTFDPTLASIVKAERNNALFKQFPDGEQSTDNTNGVLMLTGFTQSGTGTLYKTGADPDVFARVTFKAKRGGTLKIDWEYSGTDVPFKSVMVADGSPPQNVLATRPSAATFTLQGSAPVTVGNTITPITGLFDENAFLPGIFGMLGGLLIFIGSGVVYRVGRKVMVMRRRTLVEYSSRDV